MIISKKKIQYFLLPISLILILSLSRLIPHPYNFTPILAVGIFSGYYFKNFILSSFIVISSMAIGDLFLGFHNTMFFTYASLAVAVSFGIMIKKFNFPEILLSGLLGSIVFFVVTNFGSWIFLDMYEKNFSGLLQSYLLAIPFFHNTLISTLLYLTVLKLVFDYAEKKKIIKLQFEI